MLIRHTFWGRVKCVWETEKVYCNKKRERKIRIIIY